MLFAQALRDLLRLRVEPGDFVARVSGRANDPLAAAVQDLQEASGEDSDAMLRMPALAARVVDALGDRVLQR